MIEDDVLRASVDDLVGAFRDGLKALVPTSERLRLEWRDEWQHPDWERVALALFQAYVGGPIAADQGHVGRGTSLAAYDINQVDYSEVSWIGVRCMVGPQRLEPERTAMVRLVSRASPFDGVQCALLDAVGLATVGTVVVDYTNAAFTLERRSLDGTRTSVTDIVAVE